MKLLLATHNKAKLEELKMGAEPFVKQGLKIYSLDDLYIHQEPKETGHTFEENALLKAEFYAKLTNLPTIADDGGLAIDILDGEPGIKSKRWLGYEGTDEELINYTLKRLDGLSSSKRTAKLQTCLAFYHPETKQTFTEREEIKGYIADAPSGRPTDGYPYRALFIVKEFNKYYDELTIKEHHAINHRLKALNRLIRKVSTNFV